MLQFLQPILLWAAAGIIVPVIIHLWNIKEGKTLKIGSIAFFSESTKPHARSFKLSDLPLLLLRCVLLIVIAMLMARPVWQRQINSKEQGWVLIEKGKVNEVYKKFKPAIDTLLQQGCTMHYFDDDFKETTLEEALKMPGDTAKNLVLPYWALLNNLDGKVSSKFPLYLFTDNSLQRFSGSRPEVSLNLKWTTYSPTDTASRWLEKAYRTASDSIRAVIGNSNRSGTYFSREDISYNSSNKKFSIKAIGKQSFITLNDTVGLVLNKSVPLDTFAMVIVIFSDKFIEDANYLKAALNAIKDFTKYNIEVLVVNDPRDIPTNFTWLFWLSEEALPEAAIKNNVLIYEKGKVENTSSVVVTREGAPLTQAHEIGLFKFIQADHASDKITRIIWRNGFGAPLLSVDKNKTSIFHFYSHFNPQWNDLPWSSSFPQVIYDLIFKEGKDLAELNEADKRMIDPSQIQPVLSSYQNNSSKQYLTGKKDLFKLFWLIAFTLFFVERIISFSRSKHKAYG